METGSPNKGEPTAVTDYAGEKREKKKDETGFNCLKKEIDKCRFFTR